MALEGCTPLGRLVHFFNGGPSEWGDILASGTIGENGAFCLEVEGFPPSTSSAPIDQNRVYLQFGDCDVFGTVSDIECISAAGRRTAPLLEPGTCPASCLDVGTLHIEGVRRDCTG